MQFVSGGPEIPIALLQAHEDGRVVFFCGAGISYPAGLAGFAELVNQVYSEVNTSRNELESQAYERCDFDRALELLERRLPAGRGAVRSAVFQALQPKLNREGATSSHEALLELARNSEGTVRLVTTNFDRIFEHARKGRKVAIYSAPMLPIPKVSRWNGLVYLHGLLPEAAEPEALNQLVLTSGDFGLAYLTERWAARFVSELFRNYLVCFVGYSINDPVLRYMMDALAADRMRGETGSQAYAFAECQPGEEHQKTIEWQAKGVEAILYSSENCHSALHRTLHAWAETYRDGVLGKEQIITGIAMTPPSANTPQDNFIDRLLWALSDRSGLPAKRFAELTPAPPLDWLDELARGRYKSSDLPGFAVPAASEVADTPGFSVIARPTPPAHAPYMTVVSGGATDCQWDDVMYHLARWLTRHLGDAALILWLAERGGRLHRQLALLVEKRLNEIDREREKHANNERVQITFDAPNAIPGPHLRTLWRLLLTGRVKSHGERGDLYRWKERFRGDGLTATVRFELREALAPRVVLRPPYPWPEDAVAPSQASMERIVNWEVELVVDHARQALQDLRGTPEWRMALPELLDDFQQSLRDTLDLMHELEGADEHYDRSSAALPSISEHSQNRGLRGWAHLIELVRDAWLATRGVNATRADRIAQGWIEVPYPTFRRLALFAASKDGLITPERWVEWLLMDGARLLWRSSTKRETLRLLVLRGGHLTTHARDELEAAIVAGPAGSDDADPEAQHWRDYDVWLRLAKLESSGGALGSKAGRLLRGLSASNPKWKLASNERDEFSYWTSGTGDPDFESSRTIERAPRDHAILVNWLRQARPSTARWNEDNWQSECRSRFLHCTWALCELAGEGTWPIERWQEALHIWSERRRARRTWRPIASLLQATPDCSFSEMAASVASWMKAVSGSISIEEGVLLGLCRRILALPNENTAPGEDAVLEALNHPVGQVAEVLLNLWFKRHPNDGDKLPTELEPIFAHIADTHALLYGRVLLASQLLMFFRVDSSWTEGHLLPLLDWSRDPREAQATWQGFLWLARLHRPLIDKVHKQLLETAKHYEALGEAARRFAMFLTFAAVDFAEIFPIDELRSAFSALPHDGLNESAEALVQALQGAGDRRADYWRNRVEPFWRNVWPKDKQLASPQIAEILARLVVAAGDNQAAALSTVEGWLQPVHDPSSVIYRLNESGLAERYPEPSLRLLSAVIRDQRWTIRELGTCLDAISRGEQALLEDPRYRRLQQYFIQHQP